ncbi:MAG TPA: hypothetical protein VKR52_03270 [Terracidiphilus sp.]|nr:hypothetical protein [Terracidiphilus sp.]
MNRCVRRALALSCLFVLFSTPTFSMAQQNSRAKQSRAEENERLAKPVEWPALERRLFKDSHDLMVFKMATSWIPGQDHEGRFRYKLTATPLLKDEYSSPQKQIGIMSKRLQETCSISIVLLDTDGFELRRVQPDLSLALNNETDIVGLTANDSEQMDASEYKSFVGKEDQAGSWNIAWNCP